MLWQSTTVIGSAIHATDGSIGSVSDLLFEENSWSIRWIVVDTGNWLPGRKVLLPPAALQQSEAAPQAFLVDLTRQQVEESPPLASDAPVSRQSESRIYGYYGWTPYWYPGLAVYPGYPGPIGLSPIAPGGRAMAPGPAGDVPDLPEGEHGDPNLRSVNEVTGYYVHAKDGDIGHVELLMVEDESWAIRYIVVDTRNWWPGRKVLVATRWFRDVSWNDQQIHVELTRDEVRNSPEYDPAATVDRAYEEELYSHYRQRPYWL